jgi:DNA-binding transcriptional ArsR family regulator
VIDHLREQIQHRLDQVVGEADRLRKALAALGPRSSSPPAATAASPTAPARKRAQASAESKAPATQRATARRTTPSAARSSRRTAPGATKAGVLSALAGGAEMTAGQVAEKSGLPRPTVSTTLSRLAKSGEIHKAPRGYRLAPTPEPSPTSSPTASPTGT